MNKIFSQYTQQRLHILLLIIFCLCGTKVCFAKTIFYYNIQGIQNQALQNATRRMDIMIKSTGTLTPSEVQTLYSQGFKNIKKAVEPYAFFKAHVTGRLIRKGNTWTAHYSVRSGPQLQVTEFKIKLAGPGKNNPKLKKALRNLPIKVGQPFVSAKYTKVKTELYTQAENLGYLDANFTKHVVYIDKQHYSAKIDLVFSTGHRYRYGKIKIQSGPYSEAFIRRYIMFRSGQYYDPNAIIKLQRNLSNAPYFNSVHVTPHREQARNYRVPILVTLLPRKSKEYLFGLGYGTLTGPRATLGFNWYRVTDTGHRLQAYIKASRYLSSGLVRYIIPGHNPVTDHYDFSAALLNLDVDAGRSMVASLSAGYSHAPSKHWQENYRLTLQHESSKFKLNQDQNEEKQTVNASFLIPSVTFAYISSSKRIYTNGGYRFALTLKGAKRGMLATTSFIQGLLNAKYIAAFGKSFGRIIFRGSLGYTIVDDLKSLPLSLLFLTGGPESVRGFRLQSIGPGRYLKIISLEYQHIIVGNWYGAVFADAGTAANQFNRSLSKGVGIGVGYNSPVGPIQLSLAHALTPGGQVISVQVSLGPDL